MPTSALHQGIAALTTESERQDFFTELQESVRAAQQLVTGALKRTVDLPTTPTAFPAGDGRAVTALLETWGEAAQRTAHVAMGNPDVKAGIALHEYLEQAINDPTIQASPAIKRIAGFMHEALGNIGISDDLQSTLRPYLREERTREAKRSARQRNAKEIETVKSLWAEKRLEVGGNKSEFVRRLRADKYDYPYGLRGLPSDQTIINSWLKNK